jgi:FkbM family methyltransferase
MIFYDENNNVIDHTFHERQEQNLAKEYISENDVVLELGARYGLVSCAINKKLKNKYGQVSVEPDERVWKALNMNRDRNNCLFHIINGFVSKQKLGLTNHNDYNGYGTTAIRDEKSTIPYYSLHDIEMNYGLKFNVLVADCEGFLETFFDENPHLYSQLDKVIFEADYPWKSDYDKIRKKLLENDFVCYVQGFQNVYKK